MRNPLSFFMSNAVDSFRNSYIYYLVGLHISDIGKVISSLVTCWGLGTATVRHSWAALWVHIVDCPQGKKLLVQIPDCHLTWDPCTRKLGGKICQEPRHEVPSAPPPVELHGKKWSLRLTELWPGRHLGSGITIFGKWILKSLSWAKEDNIKLEEHQQICHMYSHIYLMSEKALIFYLYLQKFNMDFSLSTVIFATANFHKRKFFF